ncbi:MAG: sulfur carrier protein ThiS [Acidiferrobacterales bacterium]
MATRSDVLNIILNGEEKVLDRPVTVTDLLVGMGIADKRVAVEVNLEIVPRSEHGQFRLKDADRVEVVQAIGGG